MLEGCIPVCPRCAECDFDKCEACAHGAAKARVRFKFGRAASPEPMEEEAVQDEASTAAAAAAAAAVAGGAADGGAASNAAGASGVPSAAVSDWALCEACSKWRRLPVGATPPGETEAWRCSMNPDAARNTCAAAEQTEEEAEEAEAVEAAEAAEDAEDEDDRLARARRKFAEEAATDELRGGAHSRPQPRV